jgi:hypothetical protein
MRYIFALAFACLASPCVADVGFSLGDLHGTPVGAASSPQSSYRHAYEGAVQSCKAAGAAKCQVVGFVAGGCGAVAVSAQTPPHHAFSRGGTVDAARTLALSACSEKSGSACTVAIARCDGESSRPTDQRTALPLPMRLVLWLFGLVAGEG